MPPKKRTTRRRTTKPKIVLVPMQNGAGLFSTLKRGVSGTMGIMNQLGIKPSQVVGLIPHKAAKTSAGILSQLGLGKRKRRVGRPRKTTRR